MSIWNYRDERDKGAFHSFQEEELERIAGQRIKEAELRGIKKGLEASAELIKNFNFSHWNHVFTCWEVRDTLRDAIGKIDPEKVIRGDK